MDGRNDDRVRSMAASGGQEESPDGRPIPARTRMRCSRGCPKKSTRCVSVAALVRAGAWGGLKIHLYARIALTPAFTLRSTTAPQSKNHTNRNQSFKAHRNGIKKPKNYVHKSLKGVSCCWTWLGLCGLVICHAVDFLTPRWLWCLGSCMYGLLIRLCAPGDGLQCFDDDGLMLLPHTSIHILTRTQMDPKYLRNARFAKKHNKKGAVKKE